MHARSLPATLRRSSVLLGAIIAASSLHAADGQWVSQSGGAWLQPSNWKDGRIAEGAGATAAFAAALTKDAHVTLDVPRTIGALQLVGSRQWHISGQSITLAVNGAEPPSILARGNDYHLISTPLLGSRGLVKTGPGGVILRGANAYTGLTVIEGGKLYVHDRQALGATGPGNGTIVQANTSGSQLHFRIPDSPLPVAEDIMLRRTAPGSSYSIYNDQGETTLSGSIVLERGGRDGNAVHNFGVQVSAGILTLAGSISGNLTASATPGTSSEGTILRLRINAEPALLHIAGSISDGAIGPGGLALATDASSRGTVRLTAGNIHSGSILHAGGRLMVNNTEGSGTGSGSVLVQAVLGGTGVIAPGGANGVLVTATGVVSPGDRDARGDALTFSLRETTGNVAFDAGARLAIDLNASTAKRLAITGLASGQHRVRFNNNVIDFTQAGGTLPDGLYPLVSFDAADAYTGQLVLGKGLEGRSASLVHTANAIQLRIGSGTN